MRFLLFACVSSQCLGLTNSFHWVAGVSNAGPYALLSVVSNSVVLTPNGNLITENDLLTHQYHHHTKISWQAGVTFLAFSSGCSNEQDMGQQCAVCVSTNRGATWSSPIQVVPSQSAFSNSPNVPNTRISYSRDFVQYGGTNYLICGVDKVFDAEAHVGGVALVAVACLTSGSIGTPFLISTNAYAAQDGKSIPVYDSVLGPLLFVMTQGYGTWGGGVDNAGGIGWNSFYWTADATWDEPNTFSADGGTNNLYRTWRNAGGTNDVHTTSLSWSTNGGETWIDPYPTDIPESGELFSLRLSNGAYAIVANPHDYWWATTNWSGRDPLYLALIDPTTATVTNISAIRQDVSGVPTYTGWAKGGGCQYPSAVQVGNYLYVGYSIHKESVGFSRVLIPGLADNGNDVYVAPAPPAHINLTIGSASVGTLRMQ